MFLRKHASVVAMSLTAAAVALTGCDSDDATPSRPMTSPDTTTKPTEPTTTTPTDAMATKDIVDTAVGAGSFDTLVAAVKAAGLESTLRGSGPFTVFAPTDAAFGKLDSALVQKLTSPAYKTVLTNILKHHVLGSAVKASAVLGKVTDATSVLGSSLRIDGTRNNQVRIGGALVTQADVGAKNGVIHVLDSVLLPNIVESAVAYDDGATKFSTLVAAVGAAELATLLSGPGPFTVFAPTDEAFAKLPAGTVESLLRPENRAQLQGILKYHVVSGAVFEKDVRPGEVSTANGAKFTVSVEDGKPVITGGTSANKANIVLTDIPNSNGVIHVIDTVIIPPN